MFRFKYDQQKHALSNRYYSLIVMFLMMLLYPIWLPFVPFPRVVLATLLTLIAIQCVYSATSSRRELQIGAFLAVPTIIMEWLSTINGVNFAQDARLVLFSIFFGFLFIRIFRQLFSTKFVDEKLVVAAIVNFIILGFLGTTMMQFVISLNPNAFNGITNDSFDNYAFFYYSFITLTSVGYGDITPASPEARSIAVVLSILGQAYFSIIIGLIVGKYLSSHPEE